MAQNGERFAGRGRYLVPRRSRNVLDQAGHPKSVRLTAAAARASIWRVSLMPSVGAEKWRSGWRILVREPHPLPARRTRPLRLPSLQNVAERWEYPKTRIMKTGRLDQRSPELSAAFGGPEVDVPQNRQLSRQEVEVETAHLKEEIDFANRAYSPMLGDSAINGEMLEKYERPSQMWDWRQRAAVALGNLKGKRLLDYGCGQGEESCYFARLGAEVTAIDASDVGIRVGQQRAQANGLVIDFRVMDCLHTSFGNESFDIVHGLGILHHVGLESGLTEVYRLLAPGGVAVFMEPLQSPGTVERAKAWLADRLPPSFHLTPVTPDEENLRQADILAADQGWRDIEIFSFRLTYRVRKLMLPRALWDWSLRFDSMLLRTLPFLRRYAGAAVIVLRK